MISFKHKKVLITGGCGLIGSNLAKKLVALEANVTIIDNLNPLYGGNLVNIESIKKNIKLDISDIRDKNSIRYLIKDQDYLFNLAAQTSHIDSMTDPFSDLEINTTAQLSILELIREINPTIRIVFTSTRQIYGKPSYLPVDENHPIVPVDINGIHKLASETYHQLYYKVYNIASTCLRLTNTYGPGMRIKDARQTFLGIWIKQILMNEKINVFGDGEQLRDFNFVDDVVDALLISAISNDAIGETLNLGSNEIINLAKLAELVVDVNGKGEWGLVPFPLERKAIDIGDYYGNWNKALNMLNWNPKINLKEGIIKTIDYYKSNIKYYL